MKMTFKIMNGGFVIGLMRYLGWKPENEYLYVDRDGLFDETASDQAQQALVTCESDGSKCEIIKEFDRYGRVKIVTGYSIQRFAEKP